ncbi:MAG: hypothetical protein N3E37_02475 [Candidatus Micrarchaeota archaeon]|nr:hypothetical protein [Candidatus Micrarchaeota archaeon]
MNKNLSMLCSLSLSLLVYMFFVGTNFSEFRKNVEVQVLSEESIPIENAYVYFTYQLNSIDGYITSKALVTNNLGRANYTLYNNEFNPNKVDTKYTVTVVYGNTQKKETFDVNKTISIQTIKLPVYLVSVYLIDDKGNPANAIVEFNGIRYQTDSYGIARLYLPRGTQTITILYKNLKKEEKIEVVQNARYSFRVFERKATLYIVDSQANKIAGIIEYDGKQIIVPESGKEFVFGDDNNPAVKVIVGDYEKKVHITFQPEVDIIIPVDREAPNISDTKVEYDKNSSKVKVFAKVKDQGKYASGLSELTLFYETEEKEDSINMYLHSENDIYLGIASIPEGSKFFSYRIIAKDKEDNQASASGNIKLIDFENQDSNETSNTTTNQSSQKGSGSVPVQSQQNIIFIVIGLIILAVAIYIIYTKSKAKEQTN